MSGSGTDWEAILKYRNNADIGYWANTVNCPSDECGYRPYISVMENVSIQMAGSVEAFDVAPPMAAKASAGEDSAMIKAAAMLTRDLNAPRPAVYWTDFLASVVTGYGALVLAVLAGPVAVKVAAVIISILALYRAGSFIHELTHVKPTAIPGFRMAWNALIGIPLMIPSFMYEGVHNLHHMRKRYGTVDDPEYLPLALMSPTKLLLFMVVAFLAPVALFFRFALLAPLSALFPPLRQIVVERLSSLSINPDFLRPAPKDAFRRYWFTLETLTSIWAVAVLITVYAGIIPVSAFLTFLMIASGTVVLNQVRTLVAHLWENDGDPISVTAQYLDSVNVPPPAFLPALWAPVGLRYHAIHHLLPGVPYHSLGEAHRRLAEALPADSTYHRANYRGLLGLLVKLVRGSPKGSITS